MIWSEKVKKYWRFILLVAYRLNYFQVDSWLRLPSRKLHNAYKRVKEKLETFNEILIFTMDQFKVSFEVTDSIYFHLCFAHAGRNTNLETQTFMLFSDNDDDVEQKDSNFEIWDWKEWEKRRRDKTTLTHIFCMASLRVWQSVIQTVILCAVISRICFLCFPLKSCCSKESSYDIEKGQRYRPMIFASQSLPRKWPFQAFIGECWSLWGFSPENMSWIQNAWNYANKITEQFHIHSLLHSPFPNAKVFQFFSFHKLFRKIIFNMKCFSEMAITVEMCGGRMT